MNEHSRSSSVRARPASWLLLVLALGASLAAGAGGGQAAHRVARLSFPNPEREHGHGDWFAHVCALPRTEAVRCNAEIVTDGGGVALASSTPPAGALGPADFHTAYSLPTAAASGTPTIAIVDAGDDPNIEADLAVYDAQYNLPPCTIANGCFTRINQSGGTTYPGVISGWPLEIALDVETARAICQTCKILLVEAASNSLVDLGTAVNEAVSLGATVVSNSYGGSEFSGQTFYETTYYKHPGVAITVSAGDSGLGAEFPASSQYVTAVGGTTLALNPDGSYKSETVWGGTGSGCSAYEPKPGWQTDSGCTGRTVADVAADADPNSGAAIYDSYTAAGSLAWYRVGGTSLSAPLIAAVYALTGNGNFNYGSTPYLHPASLHDVTSGTNGSCGGSYLCTAGPGFDGPTGLGSPNGIQAFATSAIGRVPASLTRPPGPMPTVPATLPASTGVRPPPPGQ